MLTFWLDRLRSAPVPRVARFVLVGAAGLAVNTAVLWALKSAAGLPLTAAGALAIETALWNNFLLNQAWTFGPSARRRPWPSRTLAFHLAAAPAAAGNLALLLLLTAAGLRYLPANLLAVPLAAAAGYGLSAAWPGRPLPFSLPARLIEPQAAEALSRKIVVIPTYNEAANIRALLAAVLAHGPDYEALVVDDASPDGTGDIVAALAQNEPRLHLVRRPRKLGLGTAYVAGFQRALDLGAGLVFQMDADLSHDPADLPRLAWAAEQADVAVGSRYVRGGSTVGWPWQRRLISAGMNVACRLLLGAPVRDVTGGFKCWRRRVLEALPLSQVRANGFAFQIEMSYLAWQSGFSQVEVPVAFVDRRAGASKMSLAIALEAAALLARLSLVPPRP